LPSAENARSTLATLLLIPGYGGGNKDAKLNVLLGFISLAGAPCWLQTNDHHSPFVFFAQPMPDLFCQIF